MSTKISLQATVPENLSGKRLDQIAAHLFPDFSRGRIQTWIKDEVLLVNDEVLRSKDKAFEGDVLSLDTELVEEETWEAEQKEIDIVYEDEDIIVLNKAIDTVVHPAVGNRSGTLLNGLLHHCPELKEIPRAGIVHRLDKDTSGLMVVAKTLQAHRDLVKQLQRREVSREYEAIVVGVMTAGGTIDLPLGRHPVNRQRQAVVEGGKESVTHYRVLNRYRAHTHVLVKLETGRTHQIRVHMSHMRYPLVGDSLYGGRLQLPKACSGALAKELKSFKHQALHARRLGLIHPRTGEECQWESPLPEDMTSLLRVLAEDM
ncbi:MAG: 23S rRNA pseudouridine(1911/1915/1917) synthase RluD [Pseudohongiellaceae bacterium]|nr:23S rRNA pseudouridine(1911/1915/1917) synthase RluD [Pseudohongiellaceae bacterium]